MTAISILRNRFLHHENCYFSRFGGLYSSNCATFRNDSHLAACKVLWPYTANARKSHILARRYDGSVIKTVTFGKESDLCKKFNVISTNCSADSASSRVLKAEEIKPVHISEIKTFFDENNISFSEGYTCLISSCPKHIKKKMNLNEVDKLFINMTTGITYLSLSIHMRL